MATWTVLGAGSILPRADFGCSGYALRPRPGGAVTLFDCGPGSVRMLGAVGIDLLDVRRVVVSHFHVDHCLDLFALFFARRNPELRPVPPLELVGPVGLAAVLKGGEAAFGRWARDPDATLVEVALGADGRGAAPRADLALTCVATGHDPEALAWRADLPDGASVAYSGDSPESLAVAELARGVDLFVCECSHADEHGVPNHLTPGGAARLARAAGCGRLLLTHFYPGLEPRDARQVAARTFGGPIETARDGAVFEFGGGRAPATEPLAE